MANWQCAWSLGVALGVISLSLQNLSAQQIESLQAEAPSGLLERVVTLRMEGELPLHLALRLFLLTRLTLPVFQFRLPV